MNPEMIEVTQADRDAARSLERHYLMGSTEGEIAERFARHRTAAIAAVADQLREEGRAEERARVVEWLRSEAEWMPRSDGQLICDLAVAVEAGDMEP